MLAWSEDVDRKTEIIVMTSVVGELFTDYSDHPHQTCHAKPKTQINRRWTLRSFFPGGGITYHKQLGPQKTSLEKVQDAVALQQIRAWRHLWLIVVISVRQSTVCSNIWASLPGAGYGQFEHGPDQPDCKIQKRAEQSEIDVWAGCAILRSGYLHHRLPVMGC